jgi:hypothetical protein
MVRLQRKMSAKKYLGKRTYLYEYDLLAVPSEFRQTIAPFFEKDFQVYVLSQDGHLTITFRSQKLNR